MSCMIFGGSGVRGGGWGWLSVGVPSMHNMLGLSLARHVHGIAGHVHWSTHCGTLMSWALEFWLHALTSVYYLVYLFDCSVCVI